MVREKFSRVDDGEFRAAASGENRAVTRQAILERKAIV